jgi:DNA-binding MarR family transcriptional regulator
MFDVVNNPVQSAEPLAVSSAEFVDVLRQASRGLQSYFVAQARASGLGTTEYLILIRAAEDDGITAREAARAFGLNNSTMTGLTDRLEHAKLVRRHPHPSDRRVLLLKATPKGRRLAASTAGPLLAELAQVAIGIGAEQRADLAAILQQITASILHEAQKAPARPKRRAAAEH